MTRTRSLVTAVIAGLLPLIAACQTDGTGPEDDEELNSHSIIFGRIEKISVAHDCDPALDNPGDFQGWVEVWQDADPAEGVEKYALIGKTPPSSLAIHSGAAQAPMGGAMTRSDRVANEPGRPVQVVVVVQEIDNGRVDEYIDEIQRFRWSDDCWMQTSCALRRGGMPDRKNWSRHEVFRSDVFILGNPADEGCDFTIDYSISVGVPYGEQ